MQEVYRINSAVEMWIIAVHIWLDEYDSEQFIWHYSFHSDDSPETSIYFFQHIISYAAL